MVAGIVCEYNPFHNGHLYQLEKTKQAGADAIVCVMSGNFVQRGECAILDKWSRAEIAVKSGADVVIDLPVPWAVSSAENFARGSVYLLKQFGAETLSFGSETDDRETLLLAAESTQNERVIASVKGFMSEGMSYPAALHSAVKAVYGNGTAEIIASPNSTLAVEYIRQMQNFGIENFIPVKRKGADHDSKESDGEFLSASAIRENIISGNTECMRLFLGEISAEILAVQLEKGFLPCTMEQNQRSVLSALRQLEKSQLEQYVSDENGLVQRLYEAVKGASDLEELYSLAKSKNYTHSRVRREVLNAYLGIKSDIAKRTPPYMRILAVSEKGLSLLSSAKKNSAIPIVTKHGEMQNLDSFSNEIYALQCSTTDSFAMFSPKVRPCGLEQKNAMLIIK